MAVKHVRLGKHGALVSNLCLGTMNFGWVTSEEESFRIMDRALELGINFFDTADVYGWSDQHGATEEIIGRWFAQGGGRRDAVVLATKVYNPVSMDFTSGQDPKSLGLAKRPNRQGLSRKRIFAAIDVRKSTRPHFRARIPGTTACASRIDASRLRLIAAWYCASVVDSNSVDGGPPAFATRMSMGPSLSSASSTMKRPPR